MTETHVDSSINSKTILDRDDLLFFRKDRNLYGGGALIAVSQHLQPERIDIHVGEEELLFVRVNNNVIIVCYYRPHQGNSIVCFVEVMAKLFNDYLYDHVVLVGDFNFPGFDWKFDSIKRDCQYKTAHADFHAFLREHNLTQVVDEPTHIKGNTPDLICSTQPLRTTAHVISPGVSDHYIISVELRHHIAQTSKASYQLKQYRKADVDKFQESLWPTQCRLADMDDVNIMWNIFAVKLKNAVGKSVPVKQIKPK